MKKLLVFSLLAVMIHSSLYAQGFQRMQIPFSALNGLVLPAAAEPIEVLANCLDEAKHLPDETVSLNYILNGSDKAKVHFEGQKSAIPLAQLLQKGVDGGISITGASALETLLEAERMAREGRRNGDFPGFMIHLTNYTGKRLKISCQGNLQVGNIREPAAQEYGGEGQLSVWYNISLKKFNDLGYISDAETDALISGGSLLEKRLKLEELGKEFKNRKGISPDADPEFEGNTRLIREERLRREEKEREKQDTLVNDNLKKFNKLGYIPDAAMGSILKNESLENKQARLSALVKTFQIDYYGTNSDGNVGWLAGSKEFNGETKGLRETKYRQDQEIAELFSKHDFGIPGRTADERVANYRKVKDNRWLTRSAIVKNIRSDVDANVCYIYSERTGEYIPYIRSRQIKNVLFTRSEYAVRYMQQLEDNLFREKLDRSNIHILNFLSPGEEHVGSTIEALQRLFPDNHSDYSLTEVARLKKLIKAKKIKYLICLGHFGQGRIFTIIDGENVGIDVKDLYKMGVELGVYIIPLGCESSIATDGRTGTLDIVNSLRIVNELFESFNAAATLGEFLAGMARNKEFVWEFEEQTQLIKVHIFERKQRRRDGEGSAGESSQSGNQQDHDGEYSMEKQSRVTIALMRQFLLELLYLTSKKNDKREK